MAIHLLGAETEALKDPVPEGRVRVAERRNDDVRLERRARPGEPAVLRGVDEDQAAAEAVGRALAHQSRVDAAVRRDVRKQIRGALRRSAHLRQRDGGGPRRVRPVLVCLGDRDVRMGRIRTGEEDPHRVDAVMKGTQRVRVDGDPLLVRLASLGVVRGDDVGRPRPRRHPVVRAARVVRANVRGDDLRGKGRIRLDVLVDAEVMPTARGVRELIGEDQRVEVAPPVERADWVGVVRPSLVAGHVPLGRPGRPAVPGFVEAEEVVVALGAHEPFRLSDEVAGIRRVDADVRFGVVLHEHRLRGGVAGVAPLLGGIRARVLEGVRAGAFAHAGVPVVRPVAREERRLRRVAAGPLRRRDDVLDLRGGEACRVVAVALCPLTDDRAGQRCAGRAGRRCRECEECEGRDRDRDGAPHEDLPFWFGAKPRSRPARHHSPPVQASFSDRPLASAVRAGLPAGA